ncbi:unnamed protein product [Camellia sinensis]
MMGEDNKRCHSSIPLVSRLDRLDSIVKFIEGKEKLRRWSNQSLVRRVDRQCKPLDVAVREANSKGSLLDRVASLEDRLIQLCLEIESSNVPHSTIQKSWGLASGYGSKRELSYSFPTFNNPKPIYNQQQHCAQTNRFEFQGKPQRVQQRLKQPSSVKQQEQQHGNKDDKFCKNGKKGVPPNWPHFKILGC